VVKPLPSKTVGPEFRPCTAKKEKQDLSTIRNKSVLVTCKMKNLTTSISCGDRMKWVEKQAPPFHGHQNTKFFIF
jgi:hypothetical protein